MQPTHYQSPAVCEPLPVSEFLLTASQAEITRLKVFAKDRGGPDISDLRAV